MPTLHKDLTGDDLHNPAAHASSHANGESDEISIEGLSGKVADKQDPLFTHTDLLPSVDPSIMQLIYQLPAIITTLETNIELLKAINAIAKFSEEELRPSAVPSLMQLLYQLPGLIPTLEDKIGILEENQFILENPDVSPSIMQLIYQLPAIITTLETKDELLKARATVLEAIAAFTHSDYKPDVIPSLMQLLYELPGIITSLETKEHLGARHIPTAQGDMLYATGASVLTKLAKGTAGQVLVMNAGETAPEWTILGNLTVVMPKNHISGLVLSHGADTDHDITVAAGLEARDGTDAEDMVLAAETTKQFDVEWAVGDNAGGFAAGETLPASGTIHVWQIKRSDTGVVDIFGNDHATSGLTPTLPTNYDYKRRIGSYRTDASNNIINGDWWGTGLDRTFMFDTPILDITAVNPGSAAVTRTLSVPAGIRVKALLMLRATANDYTYLSDLLSTDNVAGTVYFQLITGASAPATIVSNTSSQIRSRCNEGTAVTIYIVTHGWIDSL